MQNGTLWIRRVERGSSGIYTCQASSTEGSTTHATQLLVLGALCGEGREPGHLCVRPDLWLEVHMAGVWRRLMPEDRGPWRVRELPTQAVPLKSASYILKGSVNRQVDMHCKVMRFSGKNMGAGVST